MCYENKEREKLKLKTAAKKGEEYINKIKRC